jgi:hypothetical protein
LGARSPPTRRRPTPENVGVRVEAASGKPLAKRPFQVAGQVRGVGGRSQDLPGDGALGPPGVREPGAEPARVRHTYECGPIRLQPPELRRIALGRPSETVSRPEKIGSGGASSRSFFTAVRSSSSRRG